MPVALRGMKVHRFARLWQGFASAEQGVGRASHWASRGTPFFCGQRQSLSHQIEERNISLQRVLIGLAYALWMTPLAQVRITELNHESDDIISYNLINLSTQVSYNRSKDRAKPLHRFRAMPLDDDVSQDG
jgi:hypothetical protein